MENNKGNRTRLSIRKTGGGNHYVANTAGRRVCFIKARQAQSTGNEFRSNIRLSIYLQERFDVYLSIHQL